MTFRPDVVRGAPSGAPTGVVDFRLARNSVVKEYKRGRLSRLDVCDAHPELLRNAEHCSGPATAACPICETSGELGLRLVTYVFGSRLPPSASRPVRRVSPRARTTTSRRSASSRSRHAIERGVKARRRSIN